MTISQSIFSQNLSNYPSIANECMISIALICRVYSRLSPGRRKQLPQATNPNALLFLLLYRSLPSPPFVFHPRG